MSLLLQHHQFAGGLLKALKSRCERTRMCPARLGPADLTLTLPSSCGGAKCAAGEGSRALDFGTGSKTLAVAISASGVPGW